MDQEKDYNTAKKLVSFNESANQIKIIPPSIGSIIFSNDDILFNRILPTIDLRLALEVTIKLENLPYAFNLAEQFDDPLVPLEIFAEATDEFLYCQFFNYQFNHESTINKRKEIFKIALDYCKLSSIITILNTINLDISDEHYHDSIQTFFLKITTKKADYISNRLLNQAISKLLSMNEKIIKSQFAIFIAEIKELKIASKLNKSVFNQIKKLIDDSHSLDTEYYESIFEFFLKHAKLKPILYVLNKKTFDISTDKFIDLIKSFFLKVFILEAKEPNSELTIQVVTKLLAMNYETVKAQFSSVAVILNDYKNIFSEQNLRKYIEIKELIKNSDPKKHVSTQANHDANAKVAGDNECDVLNPTDNSNSTDNSGSTDRDASENDNIDFEEFKQPDKESLNAKDSSNKETNFFDLTKVDYIFSWIENLPSWLKNLLTATSMYKEFLAEFEIQKGIIINKTDFLIYQPPKNFTDYQNSDVDFNSIKADVNFAGEFFSSNSIDLTLVNNQLDQIIDYL